MTLPERTEAERFVAGLSAGVHAAPPTTLIASVRSALEASGRSTSLVDLEDAGGKAGILHAFATGMAFPDWFGRNWDALDDALRDLSWLSCGSEGRAVLVRGGHSASAGSATELDVLDDVLDNAVSSWADTDTPLIVVHLR